MEQPHRHTHTFKFQNHQIRTVQRDNKAWFVTADVCQTLGIDLHESLGYLKPNEKNVIEGREFDDDTQMVLSIISESALDKLSHLADSSKAKEFSRWIKTEVLPQFRLSDIDNMNHLITEDILSKVRTLHLSALGKSPMQAVMETIQVLRADHPKEYDKAMRYIDCTHDFLFDSMQEGLSDGTIKYEHTRTDAILKGANHA